MSQCSVDLEGSQVKNLIFTHKLMFYFSIAYVTCSCFEWRLAHTGHTQAGLLQPEEEGLSECAWLKLFKFVSTKELCVSVTREKLITYQNLLNFSRIMTSIGYIPVYAQWHRH